MQGHCVNHRQTMQPIFELIDPISTDHYGRQGTIFPPLNGGEIAEIVEKKRKPKLSTADFLRKKTEEALLRKNGDSMDVLQAVFPLWDDERRGVPNPFIRGGLLTTRRSSDRETIKSQRIVSLSNYAINYSGTELRQDDLSLWVCLLTRSRGMRVGDPIFFTAYSLIKDLGWRMHSESYERLRGCIERMKLTSMSILTNNSKSGYTGSLIRDFAFDAVDDNGNAKWMVRLEPAITSLFNVDSTTLLEWDQRRKIGSRATITLWLHAFYSSHRDPIPYSVSKIHELCRSEEKKMANFRIRLRQALEKLVEIGFLSGYAITADMLTVQKADRPPSLQGGEDVKATVR